MTEVEEAKEALLHGDGYYLLKGAIDPELASKVRLDVLQRMEAGEGLVNSPGDINILGLLTQDVMYQELATNPRLLGVAHALLGTDCKLAAFSSKTLFKGCGEGGLHVDYPYWAMDPGMPVDPALMMQVIWMMQPTSAANGSTWVLPGSQKLATAVDKERFKAEAIQIEAEAGDAFISHGLLWHQTAVNPAEEPRVAMLINFSQLTIRPMREMGPFDDGFLESLSPELRSLLPGDYWSSLRARLKKNYG